MIHFGLPAYVGPGAGFAFLGSFLAFVSAVLAGIASVLLWPFRMAWLLVRRPAGTGRRKVIFLGFAGLDPAITERMMAEGKLPNLARLRETGSYRRLRTTLPALSQVAWSAFATGANPAKHGVFDNASKEFVRRKSSSFWKILGQHAVRSTILLVPGSLPERFNGRELAAAFVPGAYCRFTAPEGEIQAPDGCHIPFRLRPRGVEIQGELYPFVEGTTPWIKLKNLGTVRFLLIRSEPDIELYATPVQPDPEDPGRPISYPRYYSSYLAKVTGTYSTAAWADSNSLANHVLLRETQLLQKEREAIFFQALDKTRHGVLTCVFDATDYVQHAFYGQTEVIEALYAGADRIVGETLRRSDPGTAVFVLSDHGFCPIRRTVNLSAWLHREGYLAVGTGNGHIDWARTRAYAGGSNAVCLNLRGRESKGIVTPDEAAEIRKRLAALLSGLRDEETGEVAIQSARIASDIYHGPYLNIAPDIVVGYAAGYGPALDAANGKVSAEIFNNSGDGSRGGHCADPSLVPGILFSNLKITADNPGLEDMAPTALSLFGVKAPAWMEGRPVVAVS